VCVCTCVCLCVCVCVCVCACVCKRKKENSSGENNSNHFSSIMLRFCLVASLVCAVMENFVADCHPQTSLSYEYYLMDMGWDLVEW
jgi:hypothetical protein